MQLLVVRKFLLFKKTQILAKFIVDAHCMFWFNSLCYCFVAETNFQKLSWEQDQAAKLVSYRVT